VPTSCGVLLYRTRNGQREVFLVHPGGPIWATKDEGAWTIPKGQPEPGEDPETTARREFQEEVGFPLTIELQNIGEIQQKAGKIVHGFAAEFNEEIPPINCNTFTMEWPPKSGQKQDFPEIDQGEWFSLETAIVKINPAQRDFLTRIPQ
jgi:predicted NUDIX family NTP pyrophosphohydrolase